MWLATLALFMKVAVPAGFMPVFAGGTVRIELCSGFGPETMAGMPAGPGHGQKHHRSDRPEEPCGFAGHAPPAMAGADPVLLVAALALAYAAALFPMAVAGPVPRTAYLRPHPTGPPARPTRA